MTPNTLINRLILTAAAGALALGCSRAKPRAQRADGDALWLRAADAWRAELWLPLAEAGIAECLVEAATLTGTSPRLEPLPLPELPRRTPVTAVILGELTGAELPEPAAFLAELVRLRLDLESRGLAPAGFHLAFSGVPARLEGYGRFAREVRKGLDRRLLLSATVDESWIGREPLRGLLEATDYVAISVYGQDPAAADDNKRWDLDAALARARALDALDEPFVAMVGLQGRALMSGADRDPAPLLGAVPLRELLEDPRVEFEATFAFEGFYRQLLRFSSGGRSIAGMPIEGATALEISRPTVYHLSRLARRLREEPLAQRRGVVFERLPAAGDVISVRPELLLRVLAPVPPLPRLSVELFDQQAIAGGVRLRVRLRNEDVLPTAAASGDHNYVELRALDGLIGGVDLGEFRQETRGRASGADDAVRFDQRAVRSANTVRLYYPMLDGGFEVTSGDVIVWSRAESVRVVVAAHFLLPDGSMADIAATTWSGQRLTTP